MEVMVNSTQCGSRYIKAGCMPFPPFPPLAPACVLDLIEIWVRGMKFVRIYSHNRSVFGMEFADLEDVLAS